MLWTWNCSAYLQAVSVDLRVSRISASSGISIIWRADSWGAACRRCQLSALKTMEMPLDGNKYDSLLIFTVTGYYHALFWCQWLPMDENYLLRWSLNMKSTCLEHKTRITYEESRMENKFKDSAYAILVLCSRQVLFMFKDHCRKFSSIGSHWHQKSAW